MHECNDMHTDCIQTYATAIQDLAVQLLIEATKLYNRTSTVSNGVIHSVHTVLKHKLHGHILITSLKDKELYKVSTPIFYDEEMVR